MEYPLGFKLGHYPLDDKGGAVAELQAAAVIRANANSTTIRARIETGDWTPILVLDQVDASARGFQHQGKSYGVVMADPILVNDGVILSIAHDIVGVPFRVVAVDADGNVVLPTDTQLGSANRRVSLASVWFADTKLVNLRQIRLETRKSETIEFRNVALYKDHLTQVEISRAEEKDR